MKFSHSRNAVCRVPPPTNCSHNSDLRGDYTPRGGTCQGELRRWALSYASHGLPVFPLRGKIPAIPKAAGGAGVHDATTDVETVAEFWNRYPAANIGLAMGDRLIAIDIDPRHGGSLAALGLSRDRLNTVAARTGGGGYHLLYLLPSGVEIRNCSLGPGIDVKAAGGYIVVAPSVHPGTGKRYEWIENLSPWDLDPAPIPPDILAKLTSAGAPRRPASRSASRPAAAATSNVDLAILADALAVIDPWVHPDGRRLAYEDWVRVLMAINAADPGPDGLALAENWGDGRPGEIATKWRTFDPAGNATGRVGPDYIFNLARTAGWRPRTQTDEHDPDGDIQPGPVAGLDNAGRSRVESALHAHLAHLGGDCPICGRFIPMIAVDDHRVKGKVGIMRCHAASCEDWQKHKTIDQILKAAPWEWSGRYVTEVSEADGTWRTLVNHGILNQTDRWIGAPTANGTVVLFSEVAVLPSSAPVGLRPLAELAADAILAIPEKRRLRRPKSAARAKRDRDESTAKTTTEETAAGPKWQKWAYGCDALTSRDLDGILTVIESLGGDVDRKRRRWEYDVSLHSEVTAAVSTWLRRKEMRERREISARYPSFGPLALKSPKTPVTLADIGGGGIIPAALDYARRQAMSARVPLIVKG